MGTIASGTAVAPRRVAEIVRLHLADPERWTFAALAREYGHSRNTIKKYVRLALGDPERFHRELGLRPPRSDDPDRAALDEFRRRVLTDWRFIAEAYKGLTVMPFHEEGWRIGEAHRESMWLAPRGSGKSEIGCQVRSMQLLARSVEASNALRRGEAPPDGWIPDIAVAVISASESQAARALAVVRGFLELPAVERVWGRSVGHTWTSTKLYLAQRFRERADPSICALGVGSAVTTGLHPDVVILDDVVTYENSRTHGSRMAVRGWLAHTLRGICQPHTWVLWHNTPYHPQDAIASQREQGTPCHVVPAIVEADDGSRRSFWPQMFPLKDGQREHDGQAVEGLETRKRKMDADSPGSFESQYMMDPSLIEEAAVDLGSAKGVPRDAIPLDVLRVFQFADMAWTARRSSDWTAVATIGHDAATDRWYLLRVRRAKMSPTDIRSLIRAEHDAWRPEFVGIEHTGLYDREVKRLIREMADIPWKARTPTKSKAVRMLAVQDLVERGRLYAPKDEEWWALLAEQARTGIPAPVGCHDDMLDALCQVVIMATDIVAPAKAPALRAFMTRGSGGGGRVRGKRGRRSP